jgi:hypothetical protein
MTRAWRIEYEGALYHVFSRGTEKIKKRYLPGIPHAEIPAQKHLKKSIDRVRILKICL